MRVHGTDVDDRAALAHVRNAVFAEEKQGPQVDRHDPVPLVFGEIQDRHERHHRRVVDDHVDAVPARHRCLDGRLHLGGVRHVRFRKHRVAVPGDDLLDCFASITLVGVDNRHLAAFAGEAFARGTADTRSSTAHDADFV